MAQVVLMCGPAGSGKSTLARRLERAGSTRLSFDEEAWARGQGVHPLPAPVAASIHATLRRRLVELVTAGVDVVVDSSFHSLASRQEYRDLLEPLGVVPVTWYVDTPRDVALARLARRRGAGPHDVVVPVELATAYVDGFEVPTADEGPLRVVDGRDPGTQAAVGS
jgi:predicted kinase